MDNENIKSMLKHIHTTILFGIMLISFLIMGMIEFYLGINPIITVFDFIVVMGCGVILFIQTIRFDKK